jgi:hypothetical protein
MLSEDKDLTREERLLLEDWKMAKSRIEFFDDMVMRTRVQGLPVTTAIQAAGLIANNVNNTVVNTQFSALIVEGALIYLTAILCLDILHFILLMKARKRAEEIELQDSFKNILKITQVLSSRSLTLLHAIGGYGMYFGLYVVGFYLLYVNL